MKQILLGVIFAFLIFASLGVGGYFFLQKKQAASLQTAPPSQTASPVANQAQTASLSAATCDSQGFQYHQFKFNLKAPEPLSGFAARQGTMSLFLEGRDKRENVESVQPISSKIFLVKGTGDYNLTFIVNCGEMDKVKNWRPDRIQLRGRFCYERNSGTCSMLDSHLAFRLNFRGTATDLVQTAKPVDFGSGVYGRAFSVVKDRPCLSNKEILSGVVVPTSAFLKKYPAPPAGKELVFFFNGGASERLGDFTPAWNPAGMRFSVPMKPKQVHTFVYSFARFCNLGESKSECFDREIYDSYVPSESKGLAWRLVAKGMFIPYCGQSGLTMYLHSPNEAIKTPTLGSQIDKSLPPEIVEGSSQ